HNSPFNAFWNEGLVPGQGFPQIGMSAYGYGLPGLGLTPFLAPDAAILAGAGEGEISEKDLDHLDEEQYGLDYLQGHKNNDCGDDEDDRGANHHHHYYHYRNMATPSLRQLVHSSTIGLVLVGMAHLI
ncbi:hypothetical protein GQ54DRAFT_313531, partial [Martensiomyces pterosporus]